MPENDIDFINHFLDENPSQSWGFTIYRCTYASSPSWTHFLKHLNARTRLNLEEAGDDHGFLFSKLDWRVQEDPELEGASVEQVRERFHRLIEEEGLQGTPRGMLCIMVGQEHVDSVLRGPPAGEFDVEGRGYVALVSAVGEDDMTYAGLSYLAPRIFSLMGGPGWEMIAEDYTLGDVSCP